MSGDGTAGANIQNIRFGPVVPSPALATGLWGDFGSVEYDKFNIGNRVAGLMAGKGDIPVLGDAVLGNADLEDAVPVQYFSARQVSGVRGGAYWVQKVLHSAAKILDGITGTRLEDSEPMSAVCRRVAYLEHKVVREGCWRDRSRTEDDKSRDKKLNFDKHDEVKRKEEELGMWIWMCQM